MTTNRYNLTLTINYSDGDQAVDDQKATGVSWQTIAYIVGAWVNNPEVASVVAVISKARKG